MVAMCSQASSWKHAGHPNAHALARMHTPHAPFCIDATRGCQRDASVDPEAEGLIDKREGHDVGVGTLAVAEKVGLMTTVNHNIVVIRKEGAGESGGSCVWGVVGSG